jgi:hypothetical protein
MRGMPRVILPRVRNAATISLCGEKPKTKFIPVVTGRTSAWLLSQAGLVPFPLGYFRAARDREGEAPAEPLTTKTWQNAARQEPRPPDQIAHSAMLHAEVTNWKRH